MKKLSELAWDIPTDKYHEHYALSYSTIAKFEREGFSKLGSLFDRESSPSLTFGSLVDELITGDEVSFNTQFVVGEFPKLEPKVETAVQKLCEVYGNLHNSIFDIAEQEMIPVLDECDFYGSWGAEKRMAKVLTNDAGKYYRLVRESKDKQIVDKNTYDEAVACVKALRTAPASAGFFSPSNDKLEKYYQLKFITELDGVEFRCMADLLVVSHEQKVIIPVDLKTMWEDETQFCQSFRKWRYDIQARLYWRIIRHVMDQDEYYKDFELKDWQFICVSKGTKRPLRWGFSKTQDQGDILVGGRLLRDPVETGKQLRRYIDEHPSVPDDITASGLNDICAWMEKNMA